MQIQSVELVFLFVPSKMTYLVTHKLDYVQQAVLTVSFEIILLKDVYKCALQIQITLRMSKIKYV